MIRAHMRTHADQLLGRSSMAKFAVMWRRSQVFTAVRSVSTVCRDMQRGQMWTKLQTQPQIVFVSKDAMRGWRIPIRDDFLFCICQIKTILRQPVHNAAVLKTKRKTIPGNISDIFCGCLFNFRTMLQRNERSLLMAINKFYSCPTWTVSYFWISTMMN